MVEIKNLLVKYNKFLFSEENKRIAVIKAIKETIGLELEINDVTVKNGTVYLNIKPIYKNEIFLKKEKILDHLNVSLDTKTPKDIL